jgi:hypothetical protein
LKGINGGFIVFYLTEKNNFDKIDNWIYELKRSQYVPIILVDNQKNQEIKKEKRISKK